MFARKISVAKFYFLAGKLPRPHQTFVRCGVSVRLVLSLGLKLRLGIGFGLGLGYPNPTRPLLSSRLKFVHFAG